VTLARIPQWRLPSAEPSVSHHRPVQNPEHARRAKTLQSSSCSLHLRRIKEINIYAGGPRRVPPAPSDSAREEPRLPGDNHVVPLHLRRIPVAAFLVSLLLFSFPSPVQFTPLEISDTSGPRLPAFDGQTLWAPPVRPNPESRPTSISK
jgi:hypothetical protein